MPLRLFGPGVCLKERRRLVLLTRENPLPTVRLRNLDEASQPEAAAMAIRPLGAYACRGPGKRTPPPACSTRRPYTLTE